MHHRTTTLPGFCGLKPRVAVSKVVMTFSPSADRGFVDRRIGPIRFLEFPHYSAGCSVCSRRGVRSAHDYRRVTGRIYANS